MKSRVALLLDRGGWKAYENWLLSRACELERLAADPTVSSGTWTEGLGHIGAIHPSDLVRHATSFFWMNVHRFHAARDRQARSEAACHLLMTGFDSYFRLLPEGTCFTLDRAEPQTVVLPRLGVAIPNLSEVQLHRLNLNSIAVESSAGRLTIDTTQPSGTHRARTCRVFEEESEGVIAVGEAAVTTPDTTELVSGGDIHAFSECVHDALTWIASIDGELCRSIRNLIHWYVPLRSPSPMRSSRELIGVIHAPEGQSRLRLCESIVHEFHHNELFVLETTHGVAHHQKAIFYSPFRSDPRPLSGLLHGLQAFLGVARFYGAAERVATKTDREEARRKRVEFCRQLRLCISQMPERDLTALGRALLVGADEDLEREEQELGLKPGGLSRAMVAHARSWRRTNPDCVPYLRWP